MDLSLTVVGLLTAVSFIAGFVDSVAGGGGMILIPCLIFAGLPAQFALGTNKFSGTFGTGMAVGVFSRKKMIRWSWVAGGIGFSWLGSFLGSHAILAVSAGMAGKIMVGLFPVGIVALLIKRPKSDHSQDQPLKGLIWKLPLICLGMGFYDGFFGPGAGTFLAILFYGFLHLNLLQSTAQAKVFNWISNMSALAVFIASGHVLFYLAVPMAVANVIGNYAGSHMAIKKGDGFIRLLLIGVLVFVFGSLVIKFF